MEEQERAARGREPACQPAAWSQPVRAPGPRRAGRLPPTEWYPAHDPLVRVRRLRLPTGLHVRVAEAGPPDGAPVVLVHGWACSIYSFRFQLPALAAAGYRAIAFDLKGHGLSDKPTDAREYTPIAMRDFARAVLDALAIDRADLVGHSLGGGVAAQVALHDASRVARLAVISAVGFGSVRWLPALRRVPSAVVAWPLAHGLVPMPRWLWHLVLHAVAGRRRPYSRRDVDEYWAETQFRAFPLALWQLVRQYAWAPLTPAERERLPRPTLAIFGSLDPLVDRRAGPPTAGDPPIVVDGAGHAPQEEAPEEVNELLLRFLAEGRSR
ncbi:MAG TPA: alpha/beta fold hydrolase [Gemmatimonadaceae bacterium]|nr:alpha/beta fold hydrolase [Gemmatimonadaceae bacterium]